MYLQVSWAACNRQRPLPYSSTLLFPTMQTNCVLGQLGNDLCIFRVTISRHRVMHRNVIAFRLLSFPSRQENNRNEDTLLNVCVCVCFFYVCVCV